MNKFIHCFNTSIFHHFCLGPFLQVSTGHLSTCAIRENRTIDCWGKPRSPIPKEEMIKPIYDQLSIGQEHACAVTVDSDLQCWNLVGENFGAHNTPLGIVVA